LGFQLLYIFSKTCYFWLVKANSFAHFWIKLILSLLLLSFRISLYILDINSISNIWFSDIFCHSVGCCLYLRDIYWQVLWYIWR
jgi:hypothetical protein